MWGVGCGVWGVGCGVWGVGCGVWGCGVWGVQGHTPPPPYGPRRATHTRFDSALMPLGRVPPREFSNRPRYVRAVRVVTETGNEPDRVFPAGGRSIGSHTHNLPTQSHTHATTTTATQASMQAKHEYTRTRAAGATSPKPPPCRRRSEPLREPPDPGRNQWCSRARRPALAGARGCVHTHTHTHSLSGECMSTRTPRLQHFELAHARQDIGERATQLVCVHRKKSARHGPTSPGGALTDQK